jgi:hypothetical protein
MSDEVDKPKKGFAGLNSMVSKVDVPEPQNITDYTTPVNEFTATRGSPLKFNLPQPTQEVPFWKKTWFKWLCGLVALAIIINVFNEKKEAPVNSKYISNTNIEPTSAYPYAPIQQSPIVTSSNFEEQPPVGSGLTLNSNQIRYCLSEKIRLESWQTKVNNNSDVSVDGFNAAVDDYNRRCSSYRYKQYAMDTATSQVEARRQALSIEGLEKATQFSGR